VNSSIVVLNNALCCHHHYHCLSQTIATTMTWNYLDCSCVHCHAAWRSGSPVQVYRFGTAVWMTAAQRTSKWSFDGHVAYSWHDLQSFWCHFTHTNCYCL